MWVIDSRCSRLGWQKSTGTQSDITKLARRALQRHKPADQLEETYQSITLQFHNHLPSPPLTHIYCPAHYAHYACRTRLLPGPTCPATGPQRGGLPVPARRDARGRSVACTWNVTQDGLAVCLTVHDCMCLSSRDMEALKRTSRRGKAPPANVGRLGAPSQCGLIHIAIPNLMGFFIVYIMHVGMALHSRDGMRRPNTLLSASPRVSHTPILKPPHLLSSHDFRNVISISVRLPLQTWKSDRSRRTVPLTPFLVLLSSVLPCSQDATTLPARLEPLEDHFSHQDEHHHA